MADTFTTRQGDTWDTVCRAVGQPEARAHLIQAANPDHIETVLFSAGTVLTLPAFPAQTTTLELPPWKRSQ